MKPNKSEEIQVGWLIDQIQKLDNLIEAHQLEGHDFLVDQYQSRRRGYLSELIQIIAKSTFNVTNLQSIALIHELSSKSMLSPVKSDFIKKRRFGIYRKTLAYYKNTISEKIKPVGILNETSINYKRKRKRESEKIKQSSSKS